MIPFPLYHGTSSHYLDNFKVGKPVTSSPYYDQSIALLNDVIVSLEKNGEYTEKYIDDICKQNINSGTNFQHGEIYLTPSIATAVRYAGSNAYFGGELLTTCQECLDRLQVINQKDFESFDERVKEILPLTNGSGQPVLIEFKNISLGHLVSESNDENIEYEISELLDYDEKMRNIIGQQMNFRLKKNCGIVSNIYKLDIENPGNTLTNFKTHKLE